MNLQIMSQGQESTSLVLTAEQGKEIRNLIEQNIRCSFGHYVSDIVCLARTNVYSYLNGDRPITIKTLRKLLSGTDIQIQCITLLTLENVIGEPAQDVDFVGLEDALSGLEYEAITETEEHDSSSYSTLHRKMKKALEASGLDTEEDS